MTLKPLIGTLCALLSVQSAIASPQSTCNNSYSSMNSPQWYKPSYCLTLIPRTADEIRTAYNTGQRDFTCSDIKGGDLRYINLTGTNFSGSSFSSGNTYDAQGNVTYGEDLLMEHVNFKDANLTDVFMSPSNGSNDGMGNTRLNSLYRASFERATMNHMYFANGVTFDNTNLQNASLQNAWFFGTYWKNMPDIYGLNLSCSILKRNTFEYVNFKGVTINDIKGSNNTFDDKTSFCGMIATPPISDYTGSAFIGSTTLGNQELEWDCNVVAKKPDEKCKTVCP